MAQESNQVVQEGAAPNVVGAPDAAAEQPAATAADEAVTLTQRVGKGGTERVLSQEEIDGLLAGKQWIMGDQFTVADGYCLVFYGWGTRSEYPVKELKNYTAWKDRMLKRPAVMKVLQSEQNVLVK